MRLRPGADTRRSRLLPLIALILAGTGVVFVAMLAPDLEWCLPYALRCRRIELALIGLAASYGIARAFVGRARARGTASEPLQRLVGRADALAGAALSGGLSIVVAGICVAYLATWLPHYVLWPWARDADTFATLAQSWDEGIRPYRDIRGYNFPGAIYLFWLLGKTFGWGRTWPLYAVDAVSLILLGAVLVAWSRRCLGWKLPGLVSYLLFLTFYLNLSFELVAQRDWHASLCIVLGLMVLQVWPGRTARIISALLGAAALSIRPHTVLFLPALAAAVLEGADLIDDRSTTGRGLPWRRLAGWFLMLAVFTALAFSPLVIAGIAGDLVRGLRTAAYGGPYSRADLATAERVLVAQLRQSETSTAIALMVLLLMTTRGGARRRAVTWSLALGAALTYRLFHPVQHRYLSHPLALVDSIGLALPIAWMIDRGTMSPFLRVICVLLMIGEVGLGLPIFCNPSGTAEAIVSLAHGRSIPIHAPPGTASWFEIRRARRYPWEDYRNTLIYLRERTSPGTLVANVLKEPPYPAINGPTGRLSPFRAESGVCWMLLVAIDLDPEFADALEQATDSVVVWSPAEYTRPTQLRLDSLHAVIQQHYRPEVSFGRIEIWRRADAVR
jgi:hypothetical protein